MDNKLRFAILPMGAIENDIAWNVSVPHPGDKYNKNPNAQWERFPVFSVLIDHPELGWLLYDTGEAPCNEAGRMPKAAQDMLPVYAERADFVDSRLASCGLSTDQIEGIILSHHHFDHAGGLHFFQNTKAGRHIICSRKDYSYGLVESHKSALVPSWAYLRQDFEFEGLEYEFVDEDIKLAEGLELITLEGHTPCILGLMLHLESGVYIFPSDAIPMEINYGPPPLAPKPSGQTYDSLGFFRTVEKVKRLQKEYNAEIIYSHDFLRYPHLKKAPYFYE
jgi:glyoxylase-like metal-dependent hydrolase (beta-lactamase superfamily II)